MRKFFLKYGESRTRKSEYKCVKCGVVKPSSMFTSKMRSRKRVCDECAVKIVKRVKKEKPTHKICSKCEQLKPLIDFEVYGARMIRHSKLCKACRDNLVL